MCNLKQEKKKKKKKTIKEMYVQSERSRKVATTYKQEKFLFFLFFFFPFSAVLTLIFFAHIYFAHVVQCALAEDPPFATEQTRRSEKKFKLRPCEHL